MQATSLDNVLDKKASDNLSEHRFSYLENNATTSTDPVKQFTDFGLPLGILQPLGGLKLRFHDWWRETLARWCCFDPPIEAQLIKYSGTS